MATVDGARFLEKSKKKKYEKNPLLLPTEVGKTRTTIYDLPNEQFTYGKKLERDKDIISDVLFSWKNHKSNPNTVAPRDFTKLNKMSLKSKALTPTDITGFRRTHDARMQQGTQAVSHTGCILPSDVDNKHTYGIRTYYGENAKQLMEYEFEEDWVNVKEEEIHHEKMKKKEQERQKELMRQKRKSSSPLKKAPKEMTDKEKSMKESFKLKKFMNVKSRVKIPPTHKKIEGSN